MIRTRTDSWSSYPAEITGKNLKFVSSGVHILGFGHVGCCAGAC
jgi:hypothetical protein